MNVAVYGNLKSLSSQNVYGNLLLNRIGAFYTGNYGFNIQFINKPLPGNVVLASQTSPNSTVTIGSMISFVVLLLSIITATTIGKRFDNGFYFMLMTKSGEKKIYFAAMYLVDFITHFIAVTVIITVIYAFGMRVEDIFVFGLLFSLANPLFIYSIVTFMGLNRRKSSNVTVGILTGMFGLFLIIVNITGTLWYNQVTYSTAKGVGTVFIWLPLANFVYSITSVLLYRQVSIWNG